MLINLPEKRGHRFYLRTLPALFGHSVQMPVSRKKIDDDDGFANLSSNVSLETNVSRVGQIMIYLDHLDPNLPLRDAVQDLCRTDL